MIDALHLLLFLHIAGAIIAFGFGFTVPVMVRAAAGDPAAMSFMVRAGMRVGDTIITPTAISMAITGVLMLAVGSPFAKSAWLAVSVVLYVISLVLVFAVQRPAYKQMRAIMESGTPPGPEMAALAKKTRATGGALSGLVLVITFLMVTKPF